MSLIEEALRRQQEQERQRTVSAPTQPVAPQGPPPLPGKVEPPIQPDHEPFDLSALPGEKKPSRPALAIASIVALCVLLAGMTYWVWLLHGQPAPEREAAVQPPLPSPPPVTSAAAYTSEGAAVVSVAAIPPPATTGVEVAAVPVPAVTTGMTSQVTVGPSAKPAPEAPSAARETSALPAAVPPPPEPWPAFTLKGRVAFGKSYALILGDGQILEVGDRTASGIRLESATPNRVLLSFKSQTREYRLQAGTFVLLPPAEPGL